MQRGERFRRGFEIPGSVTLRDLQRSPHVFVLLVPDLDFRAFIRQELHHGALEAVQLALDLVYAWGGGSRGRR